MINLRPYQTKLIDDTRNLMILGTKSILITSPTGSGKTILMAEMLRLAAQKNKVAWFIVHRRELVKQSVRAFYDMGVTPGIIAAGFPVSKKLPIQVASIQTLIKRYKHLPKPDLIVYDECHHVASKTYTTIYNENPQAYFLGLTATPWRLDGSGLDKYFKEMLHGPSVEWLIKNGFLSPYKIYAPSTINTEGVHTRMGDFKKSELNVAADKPSITGDAIKHYMKLCNGKRAVVFCCSVEHSKHVVGQFNSAGIKAEHVDGGTDVASRDAAISRFKNGETLILSNVDLFGEGFDLPATEAVISLRPTQSLSLWIQQCGRALRPFPGKEFAIILDHSGNTMRHGLPDDERQWDLEGHKNNKKPSDNGPAVRICSKCFAAMRSGTMQCEFCGFKFAVEARKIDEVEGELSEIDVMAIRKAQRMEQGACKTIDDLVALGKSRGYKRPHLWAKHIVMARQGRR